MKKYLLIPVALLLLGVPLAAHAATGVQQTQQVILFGINSPTNAGQNWSQYCNAYDGSPRASTLKNIACIFPSAGILSGLVANSTSTPGGTAGWRVGLYKNGLATTMTCDIPSAGTTCTNATTTIAVAAGDAVEFTTISSNTPLNSSISAALYFSPIASNDTIVPAGNDLTAPSATVYNYMNIAYVRPSAQTTSASSTSGAQTIFPDAGSFTALYFNNNATLAGSGKTQVISILQNNATSTLTCTVDNTGNPTAGKCNDTADTLSVIAGDFLDYGSVPTGTPSTQAYAVSLLYRPSTLGNFVFFGGNWIGLAGASFGQFGGGQGSNLAEVNSQMVTKAMTITGLRVLSSAAPGAGATITFTLRVNGANTALACTESGSAAAAKQCTATGSVHVNDGDLVDYRMTGTGSPAASFNQINTVANLAPAGPLVITDTTATTWTVPADWTNINTIECIGAGGNGAAGTGLGTAPGAGGGGGSYAESVNQRLTPGSTVTIAVAAGGSGNDTLIKDNGSNNIIDCSAGANASTITGGSGGTSTGGSVQNAGGNGGSATNSSARHGGGGGGGAAGRTGIGQNGGTGGSSIGSGGGGGGGSAGSSATAGTAAGASATGGIGGVGTAGIAATAGLGGTATVKGGDGQLGGGGGGGNSGASVAIGGNGGTDGSTYSTVIYGSGGGGGGGGGNTTVGGTGGNGGYFGGGGGGGGAGGTTNGVAGNGGQGILIFTYAHRAMVQVRGAKVRIQGGKVRIQ